MMHISERQHMASGRGSQALLSLLALVLICAMVGCSSGGQKVDAGSLSAQGHPITRTPSPSHPFEAGIVFPRWGSDVYGTNDPTWANDVADMQSQTHAGWVEMIVNLSQSGVSGETVHPTDGSTSPDNLRDGIMSARADGLKVFLKPLLQVENDPSSTWSGAVTFTTADAAQRWFQSYWSAYQPYVAAAASGGVNQVSIGAEFSLLQNDYPDQWHWLLRQVSATFSGPITFELNHDAISHPPDWLTDPLLTYVGVSEYTNLQDTPQDISANQVAQLWREQIIPNLDQLSARVGKPVVLSEVGYRDTADCLHDPWIHESSAPADPSLQGAAYAGALAAMQADPHLAGAFFWAWENGQFAPGSPAIKALRAAYGG